MKAVETFVDGLGKRESFLHKRNTAQTEYTLTDLFVRRRFEPSESSKESKLILNLNSSLADWWRELVAIFGTSTQLLGCVAEATVTSTGLVTPSQLNVISLH